MNKIIFTGPMGAGKTTAIATVSDVPPIFTEVKATDDEVKQRKETTTVSMDYGYIVLDDQTKVHLYGTPGQKRFSYMWPILTEGGLGLVLLLDNAAENPINDMFYYLDAFADFIEKTTVVIGVIRCDVSQKVHIQDYQNSLMEKELVYPIFEVDSREANDIKTLLHALLAMLQY